MTRITSIEGNRQLLDGGAMFGNAPRPVWEKWIAPDELGRIPLACRCLLIESDHAKILCETGIGAFFEPKLAERFGVQNPERHLLLENLNKINVNPEDIDFIILSHLHFDHAGGLLPTHAQMRAGRTDLVFPKARFIVGGEAWERARHPHSRDRASFIPELTERLTASGRLVILPRDPLPAELQDRVEFLRSDGHTPGQMHTLFTSPDSGHKVFFCGDLVPGRPWVHLPITMGYDRFPEKLIDEKADIYRRAEAENWWLFFTHDPGAAAARISRDDKGRYAPTEVQTAFERFPL
jgi:glyoxylase-like metal-dependent hydrolase (beta-lactamase superfamily II)